MKSHKKIFIVLLIFVLLAVTLSLPFGVKILREEGLEGIWNRKRANIEKVVPSSAPVLDTAEDAARDAVGE